MGNAFRLRRWIVGALLTGLLLVGCLPPPLPHVVKIGMVAPFEGRDRAVGYDAIYGARLAIQELNAADPEGLQLELISYDDRGDPAQARIIARNLAADPEIVAVIGHFRQATTEAAQPIYGEAGLPLLAVGAWPQPADPPVPALMPSPASLAQGMSEAAQELPDPSLAIWGADGFAQTLRAVMVDRSLTLGTAATPAQGVPLPDGILSTLSAVEAGEQLALWRSAGWNGLLIGGPELAEAEFGAVAGAAASGSCFVTPYPLPTDLPETEAWIQTYRALGPHVPEPGSYGLPAYEAVYLLAAAVKAAPDAGRAGTAAALRATQRNGLLGPIAWDAAGFWNEAPLYRYCWISGAPRLHSAPGSWSSDQGETHPDG